MKATREVLLRFESFWLDGNSRIKCAAEFGVAESTIKQWLRILDSPLKRRRLALGPSPNRKRPPQQRGFPPGAFTIRLSPIEVALQQVNRNNQPVGRCQHCRARAKILKIRAHEFEGCYACWLDLHAWRERSQWSSELDTDMEADAECCTEPSAPET